MKDFWSRRKAAVEAETRAEEAALTQARDAEVEARQAERPDAELLAELDLPEPERIDSAETVQRFLRSSLPQRLKTRALRHWWRQNPVLANLDGLVDYADDYTDAATCVPDLQTTYQVGKGLLAHLEHLAAGQQVREVETPDTGEPEEVTAEASQERRILQENSSPVERAATDPDPEPVAPPQRRMRFRFEAG